MDVADRQMGTGNMKQSTGSTTTAAKGRGGSGRRHRGVRRAVLVGALGLTVVSPALVGGTPASAQSSATVATLYGAPNYLGGQRPLSNGEMVDFTGNTWDDAASSIRVTPGTIVALYRDPELTGICEELTADDPNLANNRIGDNQVSTIHVGARCYTPVARLYRDLNFTGESRVVGLLHSWEGQDLRRSDFNDTATSIRVPAGQTIAVYEHTKFQGRCETFTASDTDLRNNFVGNDSISSAKFNAACP